MEENITVWLSVQVILCMCWLMSLRKHIYSTPLPEPEKTTTKQTHLNLSFHFVNVASALHLADHTISILAKAKLKCCERTGYLYSFFLCPGDKQKKPEQCIWIGSFSVTCSLTKVLSSKICSPKADVIYQQY